MKQLALLESVPLSVAALEQAFGEGGASALDPTVPHALWWRALAGPAEDFLSRPGKELRAALVRSGFRLAGGTDMPESLALIVELLHAGSLVIDDVEDDSGERRGRPALHHVFGVPLAINTGSWMYFWSLAEIAGLGVPAANELMLYRAACATLVRCHQGQALDLAVRIADLAMSDCANVVAATTRLKTGTLCGFATSIGALALGARSDVLHDFGVAVGTALQMLDDVGSITTRREKAREDLRNERPTWPWAWLADTRPFMWARLVAQLRAVNSAPTSDDDKTEELDAVSDILVAEVGAYGRARVHVLLEDAVATLGAGPEVTAIRTALSAMEKSYG
jgi:geranylgeranyl pyrophosphate synthase